MQILLVDQFSPTPSPYELSLRPMPWNDFVVLELGRPQPPHSLRPTQLLEVPDDYHPPMATTAFRAGEDGNVEVWRYRWDSSG